MLRANVKSCIRVRFDVNKQVRWRLLQGFKSESSCRIWKGLLSIRDPNQKRTLADRRSQVKCIIKNVISEAMDEMLSSNTPLSFHQPDWRAHWSLWSDQRAATSSPPLIKRCGRGSNRQAIMRTGKEWKEGVTLSERSKTEILEAQDLFTPHWPVQSERLRADKCLQHVSSVSRLIS